MTFYNRIKLTFAIALLAMFSQSCTDEDSLVSSEDLVATQLQRGGGQGDRQGGPDGRQGDQVSNINSEVTLAWSMLFLELDRYAKGMRPTSTARAIAYINLAAYETAVPGMTGFESTSRSIPGLRINENRNRNINYQLALNACYADVMDHFIINLPDNYEAMIDDLETTTEESLIDGVDQRDIDASKSWGTSVARQIIEFSKTDEAAEAQILEAQPLSYEPPTGDGYWTYSADQERALFPYWGSVRTFAIAPEETTTIPPLSYSEDPSSSYYQEMVEVYNANNDARSEDAEELWIAEFWSDDVEGITYGPPTRQVSIANQLITEHDLNLEESLHLLLKLGLSLNDAAVSTWKYKYEYLVMRPNVFIHEFIDPSYQTNLYRLIPWPNPTFPGYPSGHSAFASAAAGVFIDFFGDQANFTDNSHDGRTEFRGAARSFETFTDMAAENGYSRIPLGVHIKMDCTEGLRLGYEIADAVNGLRVRRRGA